MLPQTALSHYFLWLSSNCVYIPYLLYPSVDEHLGYFYVLAIINSAAMKIGANVSLQIIVLPRYMPRSRTAGSY